MGCLGGSVKHLTRDFKSAHDRTVCEIKPCIWLCANSTEPALDSLSLTLSAPAHRLSLSKQINIKKKLNEAFFLSLKLNSKLMHVIRYLLNRTYYWKATVPYHL